MIVVEMGNKALHEFIDNAPVKVDTGDAPVVSTLHIPQGVTADGLVLYTMGDPHDQELLPPKLGEPLDRIDPFDVEARRMIVDGWFSHPSGVRGLPEHEAIAAVIHPNGFWGRHSGDDPTWVASNDPGLEALLSLYYGCPAGYPDRLEDTHWTDNGPPGVGPVPDLSALHTSWGRDMQALVQGGFGYLGTTGTATATTATSLTGGTETGVSHAANDCAGQIVVIVTTADGGKFGFIKSNTSGTTPVYTIDRWYVAASPGGAAATTPGATSTYVVMSGGMAAQFVALTTDTTTPALAGAAGTADAPAATTALTSEITTGGGGLIRKIAPIGHSAAAATWTATPVFTANGSDSLPVTVAKAALCASITAGGGGLTYMTLVSPTATLSASGDQLTLTWTFTMT